MEEKIVSCLRRGQPGCAPGCPHAVLHVPHVVHELTAGNIACNETFTFCELVADYVFCESKDKE